MGTLHVAGHRGGQEASFPAGRPRYVAARRTVGFTGVWRVTKVRLAPAVRGSAHGAKQFGAASPSIVADPQLTGGDTGGNDGPMGLVNEPAMACRRPAHRSGTRHLGHGHPSHEIVPSHSKVPTGSDLRAFWESDGGLWRGCSNPRHLAARVDPADPTQAPPPAGVTYSFVMSWPWGNGAPSPSCSSTNSQFYCIRSGNYYILRGPVPCCMPPAAVAATRR